MTFWNPARTESLQAPPHWKCGGISNISHWQKDLTAGVHTQARLLSSLFFLLFFSVPLSLPPPHPLHPPHLSGSCQIGSKAHQIQRCSFYSITDVFTWRKKKKKKKKQSVWLEISDSTAFPDIPLYVSNQQLNVNASLAAVGMIGAESVCVCLTPKCLKCPLSALLFFFPPLLYSFSFPLWLTLLLMYMQKTQH